MTFSLINGHAGSLKDLKHSLFLYTNGSIMSGPHHFEKCSCVVVQGSKQDLEIDQTKLTAFLLYSHYEYTNTIDNMHMHTSYVLSMVKFSEQS